MQNQCPPTPQSDAQSGPRGMLRPREDEHHEQEPHSQRTRRDELSEGPLEGFAAKAAALALVDDGDDAEEQAALARAAAAAAVPAIKYTAEEGDSMETKLLYVMAKQKGMITKEDIMDGIAAATRDADFDACLSYLPPKVKGGRTVFLLQVPKEHVEAIKTHKWALIEVLTEHEIKQRSSFLTGELDVTVMRFPSTSFPFEKGGGIKWDSPAFMKEGACRLVRDIMSGAKDRAAAEKAAPTGIFAGVDEKTMDLWVNAKVDGFEIANIEPEKYFCRGKPSRVTENILVAVRLTGNLEGMTRSLQPLAPQHLFISRGVPVFSAWAPAATDQPYLHSALCLGRTPNPNVGSNPNPNFHQNSGLQSDLHQNMGPCTHPSPKPDPDPSPNSILRSGNPTSSDSNITRPEDFHVQARYPDAQVSGQGGGLQQQDQLQARDHGETGRFQGSQHAQPRLLHRLHQVLPGARHERALGRELRRVAQESAYAGDGQGAACGRVREGAEGPRGEARARFQIARGGAQDRVKMLLKKFSGLCSSLKSCCRGPKGVEPRVLFARLWANWTGEGYGCREGVASEATRGVLQEPLSHCKTSTLAQVEECPGTCHDFPVPQFSGGSCGAFVGGKPGKYRPARGRGVALAQRRIRTRARRRRLLAYYVRRTQKARQRKKFRRHQQLLEALRAALFRVQRWRRGEISQLRALSLAIMLHKSPSSEEADPLEALPAPPSGSTQGDATAEGRATQNPPKGAWTWMQSAVGAAKWRVKLAWAQLAACLPTRIRGFNVRRWITWVSGEAYKPGPGSQGQTSKRHVADLNIRFHNIRGMADKNFRSYYLAQARRACGILVLAETGCKASQETEWAQDWRGSGGVFWASGPTQARGHNARGMAILISSDVDVKRARTIAHDAGGRFLAVAMEISGHPIVIVGAHAEKDIDAARGENPDAQQSAFFDRLRTEIPHLPGHRYIFAMDTNNVADDTLDYWHKEGEPNSVDRTLAVQSMLTTLDSFGAACDTFRCLYPDRKEYTRTTPPSGTARSRRRLDRIYASSALLRQAGSPRVKEVSHVRPGTRDLEAIRQMGCTCSWSDHAAVDLRLQFTDHLRAKPPWALPLHTLAEPQFVSNLMWPIRDKWLARVDLLPRERLDKMLAEMGKAVRAKTKSDSKAHHAKKSKLLKEIQACDAALDRGAHTEDLDARREAAVQELLVLHKSEQSRWFNDRGFEQSAREDTCWRGFFEETREGRVNSHVERLSGPGRMHTTMKGMFREASRFFGARGAIFNLRRTEDATEQEKADIERARAEMMAALQRDGKRVPHDMGQLLEMSAVLSDWNVQKAIEGLASNKAPGPDGWPAEFYKRMCPREMDEKGREQPSAMAALIAQVLQQCLSAGEMTPSMKQSVTTLLWKEKGTRHDLRYYRPITVTSVLYKILARSMVQSMRPVLPYLVDTGQAAFQGDPKYIGDATRLCQDVVHFCDSEHRDGFLLFCDQDNAYPRVEWDYLEAVMNTMGLHQDFVAMVNMMHVGLEGKFKINGHIGGSVKFSNSLLQGDPCAPILYLLVIQSFISMVNTSNLKGIELPGPIGNTTSTTHLRAAGFADDLLMFMQRPSQLTKFQELFNTYSKASGAVLSLPKSFGMRIGRLRHSRYDLPQGWVEGKDIQFTDDPVRYLGIFLGAPAAVKAIWDSRITAKMQRRWAKWRTRSMPRTRGGRNIVNRNSVLSCGWYAVEGQWLPELPAILEGWRQEAWRFFEGSSAGRGRAAVSRDVLVQDYHEMGVRCPDVESFVDSLYVRWVRRLSDPAAHPYKGLVHYFLKKTYGHLRQGHRLLISNCDFLCLGNEIPPFWRAVLQAFGARRGLIPAVDQRGANPEVSYAEARAGATRTVNVQKDLTLTEVLMEPCFYNQCIGGWFGAKVTDPPGFERRDKARRPTVTLYRGTTARERQAREYYNVTLAYAQVGITHVVDLLTGLQPGQRLNLRHVDPLWPSIVRETYMDLLRGLPGQWLQQIRDARELKARQPVVAWQCFVHQFPRSRTVWVQGEGGLVTQVDTHGKQQTGWYLADPTGRLRVAPCPRDLQEWWRQGVTEVVAWAQIEPPHCKAEEEARERLRRREGSPAAPTYVLAGAVEDKGLLRYDLHPDCPAGESGAATDLSRFAWQYGTTDRERPNVSCHMADAHTLYDLRISRLFTPLRTFELDADPSLDHTVWTDLLLCRDESRETVSRTERAQRRGRLFSAQHMTGHDRAAKDLGYSVLADAWPVGNGRCGKKGQTTHMLCDVCYCAYGHKIKETTRHIVLECRQARLFLDVVWRAVIEATCKDYNKLLATRRMSQATLLRESACVLVTACHPPNMHSSEPLITLVRAVQAELHRARTANAITGRESVVQFNVAAMYAAVRAKLYNEGMCRHRAALAWEAELRLRYPGWEPGEDGPVSKWERAWVKSGFMAGDECGLPANAKMVPGAAYAAAEVGVRSSLQLRPCSVGGTRVKLTLKAWVWADMTETRVAAQVVPSGHGVRLCLRLEESTENDTEKRRRERCEALEDNASNPTCVIYTDGGYHSGEGEIMGAERAGWGWVAVEGGDGDADIAASDIARACGPVHLDPTAEGYVGARKLSNNTAEGQGLAEALMWLAQASSVPHGALVLIRPDSQIVVDWATGLSAARTNHELVTNLRRLYTQASSLWRVRWSHVKGHSGHKWNDMADTLAEEGCKGEVLGFSGGKAIVPKPDPPPLATDIARYVWHVQRTVTVHFQADTDELVISSSFEDRHTLDPSTVEYLIPNQYIPPHESTPPSPEFVVNTLVGAWEHAVSEPSGHAHRLVYHSRPQDLVFDARSRGRDEAQEWLEHLVETGVGDEVEDVRFSRDLGLWQWRVTCTRYIRDLVAQDLLDITEALTPEENAAQASHPASPTPLSPHLAPSSNLDTPPSPPPPSRLQSPTCSPPPIHPPHGPIALQELATPAEPQDRPTVVPWTPLDAQSFPQPHAQGNSMRRTIFAGWGAGGRELTREIIVPAPQARRPTPRRPFDAPPSQAIQQSREVVVEHEQEQGKVTTAEVHGIARDREVGGAVEGGGQGMLGRARAALGRFASAVPRTLRNPFSLFRYDRSGGHDPPD